MNELKELLKMYPDVIKDLGGEEILENKAIMSRLSLYINNHKWFVNQKLSFTISLREALFSWYENVFIPQMNEMQDSRLDRKLKKYSKFEQFDMVSNEYYYESMKDKHVYYDSAVRNVIRRA